MLKNNEYAQKEDAKVIITLISALALFVCTHEYALNDQVALAKAA